MMNLFLVLLIEKKKMCIVSEINNLYYWHYQDLYLMIAHIFETMFPMFCRLYPPLENETTFQVIVKMQDYQISPNGNYEGRFHHEGLQKDHIKLVGIYFPEISDFYSKHSLTISNMQKNVSVATNQNTALVFTNEMDKSHQLSKITNTHANKVGTRKILLLWIIDPQQSKIYESVISKSVLNLRIKCDTIVQYWSRQEMGSTRKNIRWNDVSSVVGNFVCGDDALVSGKRAQFRAIRGKKEIFKHEGYATLTQTHYPERGRCNFD